MASTAVKKQASPVLGFDPAFQRLYGEPGYHDPAAGDDFYDARFGGLVSESRESLRQSLNTLVGSNDAEVNEVLREAGVENPAAPKIVHAGPHQFTVFFKQGKWRAKGIVDGELHRLSADDRDTLLGKLGQFAKIDVIRQLTRAEEIEIARLCACGQRQEGGTRYLRYRIGQERADKYDNPEKMIADPSLQPVFSECALFCWLNSRPDVRDSAEFQNFAADYAGSRPLTFSLLDAAWDAFGPHQEKGQARAAAERFRHSEPLPDERSLNDMSDEEVSRQFWQTARYVARGGR